MNICSYHVSITHCCFHQIITAENMTLLILHFSFIFVMNSVHSIAYTIVFICLKYRKQVILRRSYISTNYDIHPDCRLQCDKPALILLQEKQTKLRMAKRCTCVGNTSEKMTAALHLFLHKHTGTFYNKQTLNMQNTYNITLMSHGCCVV